MDVLPEFHGNTDACGDNRGRSKILARQPLLVSIACIGLKGNAQPEEADDNHPLEYIFIAWTPKFFTFPIPQL